MSMCFFMARDRRGKTMRNYSLTEWILFLYLYSFLGWIWESCYVSCKKKQWVNRGFMHGPILPIYGSGAVMVLLITLPVQENIGLIFLFGMLGTTVLEYVTGDMMEALFHVRYWDYSKKRFNFKGHICLGSSLAWGVFSILMVKVLHQPIEELVIWPSVRVKELVALGITVVVLADFIQSFNEAMNLKEILNQLSQTNVEIHMLRKRLDVMIAIVDTDTTRLKEKLLQSKQAIEEKFLEEKRKYEEVLKEQLERSQYNTHKRKQEIEYQLERMAQYKNLTLQNLSEKATTYLEQIEEYTKDKGIYPTKEIGKLKVELEELKEKLKKQREDGLQIRQKAYRRSVRILHRNPNVVSKKYEEALKEIQSLEKNQE